MQRAFTKVSQMLALMVLVSSFVIGFGVQTQAHEVSPTVGDIEIADGQAVFDLTITLESFLAGIDLDVTSDTNTAANAAEYDRLRALAPEALAEALRQSGIVSSIGLTVDGTAQQWTLEALEIPDVGNIELPRDSEMSLVAQVSENAENFRVDWPKGYGMLILRQNGPENPYTGYISGGESSPEIPVAGGEPAGFAKVLAEYIPVGFDHILPKGLDHILFVLGLFFFSTALRPLIWQVTAFTLAHTVTLALGALGIVNIPGSIVEPIIAASIVYVAVENIFATRMGPWRPVIIFIFGLLHGLGFASVLGEFGLPSGQFIAALIGFNIGVELGQLTVIALAFLAVGYWFGKKPWYRAYIAIPASVVIAAIGAYWVVERTLL